VTFPEVIAALAAATQGSVCHRDLQKLQQRDVAKLMIAYAGTQMSFLCEHCCRSVCADRNAPLLFHFSSPRNSEILRKTLLTGEI
jgi:hypothetical protein